MFRDFNFSVLPASTNKLTSNDANCVNSPILLPEQGRQQPRQTSEAHYTWHENKVHVKTQERDRTIKYIFNLSAFKNVLGKVLWKTLFLSQREVRPSSDAKHFLRFMKRSMWCQNILIRCASVGRLAQPQISALYYNGSSPFQSPVAPTSNVPRSNLIRLMKSSATELGLRNILPPTLQS